MVQLGLNYFSVHLHWIQNYILIQPSLIKYKDKKIINKKFFSSLEVVDFEKIIKIFHQNSTKIYAENKKKFTFFIFKNNVKFFWYNCSSKKKKFYIYNEFLHRFIADIYHKYRENINIFKIKKKFFLFWFKTDSELFIKSSCPLTKIDFDENFLINSITKLRKIKYYKILSDQYKALNPVTKKINRNDSILNKNINFCFWEINRIFRKISIESRSSFCSIDFLTKKILEPRSGSIFKNTRIDKESLIKTRILCYWMVEIKQIMHEKKNKSNSGFLPVKYLFFFTKNFFKISFVILTKFLLFLFNIKKKLTHLAFLHELENKFFYEKNPDIVFLAHFLVLHRLLEQIGKNLFFFRKL